MQDYMICRGSDPEILQENVKAMMEKDWIPLGGPLMCPPNNSGVPMRFYQAMVLTKLKDYGIVPQHKSKEEYQQAVTDWKIKFNKLAEFGEAYPIVDIKSELQKASLWLYTNTSKRKKAFDRFFNNWCARIQEKGLQKDTPLNIAPLEDL